jgi:hypothetical protein
LNLEESRVSRDTGYRAVEATEDPDEGNMEVQSRIIKEQRMDERKERIQLHQQSKLGMY